MSDLSTALKGLTVAFGSITLGKVLDASPSPIVSRPVDSFQDCLNDMDTLLHSPFAYGAINVRCACYLTSADIAQLLKGTTLSFNGSVLGQLISLGGTAMTRRTSQHPNCGEDQQTILYGGAQYGAMTASLVHDYNVAGDFDNLMAKAIAAAPSAAIAVTLADTLAIACSAGYLTELHSPGGGSPRARVEHSLSLSPVDSGVWAVTGVSPYKSLFDKAINAAPTDTVSFTYKSTAVLSTTSAVITSLDLPTAGNPEDEVTFGVTFQPVNKATWAHAGVA